MLILMAKCLQCARTTEHGMLVLTAVDVAVEERIEACPRATERICTLSVDVAISFKVFFPV